MDCKTSSALIMSYVDETIEDQEWVKLQEHINNCSKCRDEFQVFTEMLKEIEELPMYEPSKDFEFKVMESIDHSLYTTKQQKIKIPMPVMISVGIYMTYVVTTMRAGLQGGGMINIAKIMQQLSLLNRLWEKVTDSSLILVGHYIQSTIHFIYKLATLNSINFVIAYSFSLLTLMTLLIFIKKTILGLLKINGGDFRWIKIDMEE